MHIAVSLPLYLPRLKNRNETLALCGFPESSKQIIK
jgi:hypothetical protein